MVKLSCNIVEVCVFRVSEGNPQFLLLQRSPNDELYPNLWQIITGTIIENETAKDAALRELDEETGLLFKHVWNVPYVDSFYMSANDSFQFAAVFSCEVYTDSELSLSKEHQKYEWLDYLSARERLVWPGHRQILEIVNEYIVKGATASKLLEIAQQ